MTFEELLLRELRQVVAERPRPAPARRRRGLLPAAGLAGAVAVAALLRAGSGGGAPAPPGREVAIDAYRVSEAAGGTVVVEINAIEDADGLERRLAEAGIPAAVHYLPGDRLCAEPDGPGGRTDPLVPAGGDPAANPIRVEMGQGPPFTITIDRTKVVPGRTLVIWTQYDHPEHGQRAYAVASLAAAFVDGDPGECVLVAGDIGGWAHQDGAVPPYAR